MILRHDHYTTLYDDALSPRGDGWSRFPRFAHGPSDQPTRFVLPIYDSVADG